MNLSVFISASDTSISSAALYALIGFLIVLAVLAVLVGIFYLTGFLFRKTKLGADKLFERKPKNKVADKNDVPVVSVGEDDEVVAVITAAISAMYAVDAEGDKPNFVIRRIRRK